MIGTLYYIIQMIRPGWYESGREYVLLIKTFMEEKNILHVWSMSMKLKGVQQFYIQMNLYYQYFYVLEFCPLIADP